MPENLNRDFKFARRAFRNFTLKTLHKEPVAAASALAVSKKHNLKKHHNSDENHRKIKANVQRAHTGKTCGRCGRQHQNSCINMDNTILF